MTDILIVALLTALVAALNAYAARMADRDGPRRARLESDWDRLISGAMSEVTVLHED